MNNKNSFLITFSAALIMLSINAANAEVPQYCTSSAPPPVADVCPDVNSISVSNGSANAPNGWRGNSKVNSTEGIDQIYMTRWPTDPIVYCEYRIGHDDQAVVLAKIEPTAPGTTWWDQGYVMYQRQLPHLPPPKPCDYANAFLLNCWMSKDELNSGSNKSCYLYDHRPCDPPQGGQQC